MSLNIRNDYFDVPYLDICKKLLDCGNWRKNERTGINCLFYHGEMIQFDLSGDRFPLLTTKKIYTRQMIAELLGFIRGVDNAKDFRDLGCNFWNENANTSKHWLENPHRKGEDDLGRIYGVQARRWAGANATTVDQLKIVVQKLCQRVDDRRLIVSHWNPGELNMMALPPCHMFYQFGIRGDFLDLTMYQRSCDVPLGVPMNIASYALLLELIAQITKLKAGIFTHFLHNIHIYENQLEGIREQVLRKPYHAPRVIINPSIVTLEDLETWVTPNDIAFEDYQHHPAITFPFAA